MNLLYNFFKVGISFLLANQVVIFLKNKYPDDYNNYIISISYNVIFIYSKAQLITMKVFRFIQTYMDSFKKNYPELSNLFLSICKDNEYVEFIKDCEVFLKTTLDNINKINTNIYNSDFILLTKIDENNIKNKRIYYNLPDDNDISIIEKSNVTFILVELIIQNYTIVLHFKNDVYNYLIIGNEIDFTFLIYFLKTHYKHEYEKLDFDDLSEKDFKMRIIDGNINNYEFDMSSKIKINHFDFQIIQNQEEEEKELMREFVINNNKDNFLHTDDFMESFNTKVSSSFDFNNKDINEMDINEMDINEMDINEMDINEIIDEIIIEIKDTYENTNSKRDKETNENILVAEPKIKIRKPSETEYECL